MGDPVIVKDTSLKWVSGPQFLRLENMFLLGHEMNGSAPPCAFA